MTGPAPNAPLSTKRWIARVLVALGLILLIIAAVAELVKAQAPCATTPCYSEAHPDTSHDAVTLVLSSVQQANGTFYSADLFRRGELIASVEKDTREGLYRLWTPEHAEPYAADAREAARFIREHMGARGFRWSWKP